jgi:lipopolysaccharide transport system permease protein
LKDLYFYRHFIKLLVSKEFKKRYSQSFLGLAWAIIEPLILVLTLSVIFTHLGRQGPHGTPFPVFFYSGLLLWNIFSKALSDGPNAFIQDAALLQKTNFPRQACVLRALTTYFVEFLFSSSSFICILIYYGYSPRVEWFYIPLLLIVLLLISYNMIILLASINVYVRDVGILARSLSNIWFWATPIIFIFPDEGLPGMLNYVNPIAGIIANLRNILIFNQPMNWGYMVAPLTSVVILFILGHFVFKKLRGEFIDVI